MSAQGEVLSNHRATARRKRSTHALGPQLERPLAPSAEQARGNAIGRAINALLEKLSVSLGIFVATLGLILWLGAGFILGKLDPEYTVTVQQFEIAPELAKKLSLSGKSASDIVVDTLNDAETHSSQFHGTDYYEYDGTVSQSVSLKDKIKVPVQTTYGIEVKGISLDNILQLYNSRRYQQWVIGGDIFSAANGMVGRIRLNREDAAQFWETAPSANASPTELIRNATYAMLASVSPELLARSYLQQRRYAEAAAVLRDWEIAEPQNWKPTYYLSLAYSYQEKAGQINTLARDAADLAQWSESIADHERVKLPTEVRQALDTEIEQAPDRPKISRALVQAREDFAVRSEASGGTAKTPPVWKRAWRKLLGHFEDDPATIDSSIRQAKGLDAQATTMLAQQRPSEAFAKVEQAIGQLGEAIKRVPENGGLHEQKAMLLNHLATIMKTRGDDPQSIREKEEEEVEEEVRALELKPSEASPLWGAVYAQLDLGRTGEAVQLARTISLLVPQSAAANMASIIALEGDMKVSGKDPAAILEVESRLKPLLNLDLGVIQLQTLLHACDASGDVQALELIAREGRRRFPETPDFRLSHASGRLGDGGR